MSCWRRWTKLSKIQNQTLKLTMESWEETIVWKNMLSSSHLQHKNLCYRCQWQQTRALLYWLVLPPRLSHPPRPKRAAAAAAAPPRAPAPAASSRSSRPGPRRGPLEAPRDSRRCAGPPARTAAAAPPPPPCTARPPSSPGPARRGPAHCGTPGRGRGPHAHGDTATRTRRSRITWLILWWVKSYMLNR